MASQIRDNVVSDNGLLAAGTKPLPEQMFTLNYRHPPQRNFTKNAQDLLTNLSFEIVISWLRCLPEYLSAPGAPFTNMV